MWVDSKKVKKQNSQKIQMRFPYSQLAIQYSRTKIDFYNFLWNEIEVEKIEIWLKSITENQIRFKNQIEIDDQ